MTNTTSPSPSAMVATSGSTAVLRLVPQTLAEVQLFAERISRSNLCPTAYRNKPEDVWVAIIMGLEIGLSPMQAVQNIAVINGKPCVYGDAMLAVCKSSRDWEWMKESIEKGGDGKPVAVCTVKRRGEPEVVQCFALADAAKAGLLGKGPWQAYPNRMLQMRARGFALRDAFPDALRGISSAEEVADYNNDVPMPGEDVVPSPTPLEISGQAPKPAQHAPRRRGRPTNAERAARAAHHSDDEDAEPAPVASAEEMPEPFRPFVRTPEPEPSPQPEAQASQAYTDTMEALRAAKSTAELSRAAELGLGISDGAERENALQFYRTRKAELAQVAQRGAEARANLTSRILATEEVG